MIFALQKIYSAIFDFFFPAECVGCKKEDFWICPKCIEKIRDERERLSGKIPHIKIVWALSDYHKPIVEKSIRQLKFGYCQNILKDMHPFFKKVIPNISFPKDAIFCPVPLHFIRKNNRGFNQAKSIAEEFFLLTNIPVQEILKRRRNTPPQTKLSGEKRRKNLENAFSVKKKHAENIKKNTPIILVDDVTTTFSTLQECAKTLKKSGFKNVYAVVIARSE